MTSQDCSKLLEKTWIAQVEYHATITSTNDRAAELAKGRAGELPLLVIADVQTAGRGRGGNRWWTGEGSLAFSVLFDSILNKDAPTKINSEPGRPRPRPSDYTSSENSKSPQITSASDPSILMPQTAAPLVGLAAALAVVEAVRPLVGDCEIGLHWPNDVFAAGRKLAGILVEVLADRKAIVGIGLNVNNSAVSAPRELQAAATTLYDLTQARHDRTEVLISLLTHWKRFLDLAGSSPEKMAAAADAVCLQKNKRLHLQWGAAVHSGVCRGIDGTGAILLETDEGIKAYPSGVLLKNA